MLETLEIAPLDPILGLTETFKSDPRKNKINLGVGVFKDASGATPVLSSVKLAEALLLEKENTKNYLEISGSPEFGAHISRLLFTPESSLCRDRLALTAQTPGGTAALRVACELVKKLNPKSRAWMSDPTWANHANVFRASGIEPQTYPYYDFASKSLAFDRMLATLEQVPAGDLVLFHACCHNPSGMDPTTEQWRQIAELSDRRGFLPLFDSAYQGFAKGLDEDAAALRIFAKPGREFLVASSYSKNFGLYNERVGALSVVAASAQAATRAFSHVKNLVRANYSNPPSHGAAIVTTILDNPELTATWKAELAAMRDRINEMRRQFAQGMTRAGCVIDFSFITHQHGMFSFLGLSRDQVLALRERHAVYIIESSRINVAGLTPQDMERVCRAITEVISA